MASNILDFAAGAEAMAEEERERRARLNTYGADPQRAGEAAKLARETGMPRPYAERHREELIQRRREAEVAENVRRHPELETVYGDPDRAEIAADDAGILGSITESFKAALTERQQEVEDARGLFGRMRAFWLRGVSGVGAGWDAAMGAFSEWSAENPLPWTSEEAIERDRAAAAQFRERAEAGRAVTGTAVVNQTDWEAVKENPLRAPAFIGEQGVQSIPAMLQAAASLPSFVVSQTGNIGQDRAENEGRDAAEAGDVARAAPFALLAAGLERVGLRGIIKPGGATVRSRIGRAAATEALTEFGQSSLEYMGGTLGTEAGYDPLEMLDEAASGFVAGGGMGAGIRSGAEIGSKATRLLRDRSASARAERDGEAVDALMDGAQGSMLRERDPDAFRALVERLAGGSPVENIYVPAETARALYQSDDGYFSSRGDEIAEAEALGGDVVIPVADAAANMEPDTWNAVREEARFTPGGMSRREAQSFEEARADAMAEIEGELGAEFDQAEAERSGRQAVYDEAMQRYTQAGFTPDVARQYAELVTAYQATRAERLGEALTGDEAGRFDVRLSLPEGIAEYRAANDMDILIETARKMRSGEVDQGQSLLEFIAARGGIRDNDGDLAAMDAGEWTKGKAFRKRLVLEGRDRDQGAMLAPGPKDGLDPDDVALAAWEAGYFPELGDERPDVNALYEAMREELAGGERYAEIDEVADSETLRLRRMAEELEPILAQMDVDLATATADDVTRALDQYEQEGRAFEQAARELPDAIDIGGQSRPTRNSNGQPLAATEEGVRNFWAWFGDSKVVDAEGRPLVVYHGSLADIESFDRARLGENTQAESARAGFFFTSDPDVAASYAHYAATVRPVEKLIEQANDAEKQGDWDAYDAKIAEAEQLENDLRDFDARQQGQNVIAAYLRAERPVERDAAGESFFGIEDAIHSDIRRAKRSGDGAIFRNLDDAAGLADRDADHFLVFDGEQIKSVNNRGTFDPADPRILNQDRTFNEGPRGRMIFRDTGPPLMELFGARDLSTFFHEFGHFTLEDLKADATTEGAEQLRADWEIVKAWFEENSVPVGEGGDIPVAAHEMWARGFERYLMEGKAPSQGLRGVFKRAKAWLLRIYEVVANLNAPITDDVRGVMDRLLATEQEIREAQELQEIRSLFPDAETAGMTEAEFGAYSRLAQNARDEGEAQVIFRTMSAIRKSREAEWKEREREVREEVKEALAQEPQWRAYDRIRADKSLRLGKAALADRFGADALTLMPGSVPPLYREGGADPDVVAERLGFRSGEEMVKALMGIGLQKQVLKSAGNKKSPRQHEIDRRTAQRMYAENGDILNSGEIEAEALAAVHNEKQGEVLSAELRQLGKRSRRRPTPYTVAKQWAADKIASGEVRHVASRGAMQQYLRSARKSAKAAEEAMLAQNWDEAFRQKQAQMLNNALVAEAKKAHEEVEKITRRLGKVAKQRTVRSIDQDYLEQAHALLEQYEFKQVSQRRLDEREGFEAWAEQRRAEGYDVVEPPRVRPGITNWSRMSVADLQALDESVKQVLHIGRTKQKLLDAEEQRKYDEVVEAAVDGIRNNLTEKPPADMREPGPLAAAGQKFLDIEAALLKAEEIFDWLDGGDPQGVFNQHVFKPIAKAQDAEKSRLKAVNAELEAHVSALPKDILKRWQGRVDLRDVLGERNAAGRENVFTRDQLVAMALNVGNEGNLAKLAGGYGVEPEVITGVLNQHLSAAEWQYVQNVWDTINGLWPDIAALERRVNGVAPEKVEPREIETPHGTFRGGYYPVVYDPKLNYDAERNAADDAKLFEGGYTRATTRAGSTRERTNVERPILLDLGIQQRHVAEVVHDITHREPVMQAWRFLSDRRIMRAIDDTLGSAKRKQLLPWVQHVANEWAADRRGASAMNGFFRSLRTNATMVGLGCRFSTMMLQVAGYSNSFERVGVRWVAPQIGRFATDPVGMTRFAMERSGELRARMETLDRDIRETVRRSVGKRAALSEVKRFAFAGIGMMDRVVSVPTWTGAYNKALAEWKTEEQAIYEGDKAVRQSQGSGAAKDLAAVQRPQNEILKWATMFYSYLSALYQRQRRFGRDVASAKIEDAPELIARGWWLLVVPTVLSEILAGRGPEEDEEWTSWAAKKVVGGNLGGIPLARDAASSVFDGYRYEFSPAAGGVEGIIRGVGDVTDVAQGEGPSERWLQNALETVGFFTGRVPGQVASSSQFLLDVFEGDAEPETAAEWIEGITKGRISED